MPRPIKVTYMDSSQSPFRLPMARYLALRDSDLKFPVFQEPPVWKKPQNLELAQKLDRLLQTLPAKHK
ncbi:MAG TPA: hypothetical protein VM717_07710 [Chthoniobacterales bacterium]|nr:hypothetical protein [Chthoniobacterales bacterium]